MALLLYDTDGPHLRRLPHCPGGAAEALRQGPLMHIADSQCARHIQLQPQLAVPRLAPWLPSAFKPPLLGIAGSAPWVIPFIPAPSQAVGWCSSRVKGFLSP